MPGFSIPVECKCCRRLCTLLSLHYMFSPKATYTRWGRVNFTKELHRNNEFNKKPKKKSSSEIPGPPTTPTHVYLQSCYCPLLLLSSLMISIFFFGVSSSAILCWGISIHVMYFTIFILAEIITTRTATTYIPSHTTPTRLVILALWWYSTKYPVFQFINENSLLVNTNQHVVNVMLNQQPFLAFPTSLPAASANTFRKYCVPFIVNTY